MPDAQDEQHIPTTEAERPVSSDAPETPDSAAESVIEAEAVEAPEEAVEVVEAQVVEAELVASSDEGEGVVIDAEIEPAAGDGDGVESDEGKRPSVHGRLAKPHKKTGSSGGKAEPGKRKAIDPTRVRRVVITVLAGVLAALLVGAGLFCWQKWLRFDDAADIQGVWKVQATGDTIVFDGRNLKLTRGISYEYRLDADEKTIAYSFGELEGGGHYYFSADRQMLVIVEGDERLDALAEVGFLPSELVDADNAADDKTVLAKVSDDTSAEPSGTATGVAHGALTGEREYVVQPEPEPSSSSSSSKKKQSDDRDGSDEGEDGEHTGFVDEDGDGYDDYTGLDYEEFYENQGDADEVDEASEDSDAEEEYADEASDESGEDTDE